MAELDHRWRTNVMQAAYVCREAWDKSSSHCEACADGCGNRETDPECQIGLELDRVAAEAEDTLTWVVQANDPARSYDDCQESPIYGFRSEEGEARRRELLERRKSIAVAAEEGW